jgi:hypothetical protein
MIPYEDLVAALDNWRMRKGMPVATTEVPAGSVATTRSTGQVPAYTAPAAYAAPAASYGGNPGPFVMPAAAAAAAPRPVSTSVVPTTESDVLSIDDAEVEDEMYENEGSDFAMNFNASGNPTGAVSGSIGDPAPMAPPPIEAYEDHPEYEDDQAAYAAPAAAYEDAPSAPFPAATYDDPAYDEPVPAEPLEALGDEPEAEPEDEDWSKLYPGAGGAPGPDTMDAEPDVVDEQTVVGDPNSKR